MSLSARRAWIEMIPRYSGLFDSLSLSARRAWIEMLMVGALPAKLRVALRKESVDRNVKVLTSMYMYGMSLSARRAWIEISMLYNAVKSWASLSARRAWIEI